MPDSFEVVQSSSDDGLSDEQRHEVVAAQLRGEAKAEGQGSEAVVAAVAEELGEIGLEPDPSELHRRYEEIDPDIPELADAGDADLPPADAGTAGATSGDEAATDRPVSAGLDATGDHHQVDDAHADAARDGEADSGRP